MSILLQAMRSCQSMVIRRKACPIPKPFPFSREFGRAKSPFMWHAGTEHIQSKSASGMSWMGPNFHFPFRSLIGNSWWWIHLAAFLCEICVAVQEWNQCVLPICMYMSYLICFLRKEEKFIKNLTKTDICGLCLGQQTHKVLPKMWIY